MTRRYESVYHHDANGRGGQHVGTASGVRAIDDAAGVSVTVTRERSHHANRRLADAMLDLILDAEARRG